MYETIAYFYCGCGLIHYADEPEYVEHLGQRGLPGVLVYGEGETVSSLLLRDE